MECCNEKHGAHSGHAGGKKEEGMGSGGGSTMLYVVLGLLMAGLAFNQYQLGGLQAELANWKVPAVVVASAGSASSASQGQQAAGQPAASVNLEELASTVIPAGVPAVYGSELGVSYSEPVKAISIIAPLEQSTSLDSAQLSRYIGIASQISCEYCCGAPSIITRTGDAACGCAHSGVMRGLGKYLVKNHPEMSDAQVLEEMSKWKTLFFPKQILSKAIEFKAAGKQIDITDLASNEFRGFKASTPSSAGGVSGLPDMVGGC